GRTAIGGIMSRDVITVGLNDMIEDAAKLLYRHRIGALPVVDAQQQLRGLVTETDILHAFVRILGVAQPSSRIEVGLEDRPGELGRALSIVGEQAGVNVVSVLVPPWRDGTGKTAVLHLGTIDPRDAIEALETAGYAVGWPSLQSDVRKVQGAPLSG